MSAPIRDPAPPGRRRSPIRDPLAAGLTGLLLTAAFPPGPLPWLICVALVPLLAVIRSQRPWRAFRLGLIAGLTHGITLLYWVVFVLERYAGLGLLASLGPLLLLCLYLALYPAVFFALAARLGPCRFRCLLLASLWVVLEYLRGHLLSGFPWCLLGHAFYDQPLLIQITDVTGVYGISFLIVGVNVCVTALFFPPGGAPRRALWTEGLLLGALLAGLLWYGQFRLSTPPTETDRELRVTVVQPNIDQAVKWDPALQDNTLTTLASLTLSARAFRPDLIIWPETAVPFFFQEPQPLSERVSALSGRMDADLLFGGPAYRERPGGIRYLNRAYLIAPRPAPPRHYDKVHLVPFGEYVPLARFLFFIHRLVSAAGDFEAGERIVPLPARTSSIGVLICFEAIFPELARRQVRAGADLLVNLTNDAWFGLTSAPHQHLALAVFRAVETRRPLIRAANTGISAFVEPSGVVRARTELARQAVLSATVPLHDSRTTVYTRYGDLLVAVNALLLLIGVLRGLWAPGEHKRRPKRKS